MTCLTGWWWTWKALAFLLPTLFFFCFLFFVFSIFVADSNYVVWVFMEAYTYLSTWTLPLGNSCLALSAMGVNLVSATIWTSRHQGHFCSSIPWDGTGPWAFTMLPCRKMSWKVTVLNVPAFLIAASWACRAGGRGRSGEGVEKSWIMCWHCLQQSTLLSRGESPHHLAKDSCRMGPPGIRDSYRVDCALRHFLVQNSTLFAPQPKGIRSDACAFQQEGRMGKNSAVSDCFQPSILFLFYPCSRLFTCDCLFYFHLYARQLFILYPYGASNVGFMGRADGQCRDTITTYKYITVAAWGTAKVSVLPSEEWVQQDNLVIPGYLQVVLKSLCWAVLLTCLDSLRRRNIKPEDDTAIICLISVCSSWKQGNWNLCFWVSSLWYLCTSSAAKLHIFAFIMDTEGQWSVQCIDFSTGLVLEGFF